MADNILSVGSEFFALRNSLINYTGIITIAAMSIAMILMVRSLCIESFLDGLDKSYRLHKWMGISALVVAIVHWLWAQAPKWMVGLGLLTRPARQPRADPGSEILRFFQSQRGLAEQLGEWAFYAAVVLILLALVKRFPYHLFFKVHRLLAITYLLLVFHSVVLIKFDYWGSGIGPLMAVLMMAGMGAALMSLFRRIGHSHKALGTVEDVGHHRDNRVFKVQLKLKDRWPGHEAGQFAFITFDRREGSHPFTIASSWHGDGRLKFHIKGIGD
jgi:predicted ferric reductase